MGLFSFFSRKKKSSAFNSASANLASETATPPIAKRWHHAISEIAVVTHPLGSTPGTECERDRLYSYIYSLSHAISELENEAQNLSSKFYSLASSIAAKSASEGVAYEKLDVVGLTHDSSLGYSARISSQGKKFTVLFGEPLAVARASTPFHEEITAIAHASYVLAIDGIAYVALTLSSELR